MRYWDDPRSFPLFHYTKDDSNPIHNDQSNREMKRWRERERYEMRKGSEKRELNHCVRTVYRRIIMEGN